MSSASTAIATMFGVGRASFAPGTVASAVALPFAWLILWSAGPLALLGATILATAGGTWACEVYARERNITDPPECVVDELAGQWLACAFAPLSIGAFVLAFALFRLFDIAKPWPISAAERLRGGFGIMADDLAAGLVAGLLVAATYDLGLV